MLSKVRGHWHFQRQRFAGTARRLGQYLNAPLNLHPLPGRFG